MDSLQELEIIRKKMKLKKRIFFSILAIVFLSGFIFDSNVYDFFLVFFYFFFLIWFVILRIILSFDENKFKQIYKQNVVLSCFNEIFSNVDYKTKDGLAKSVIENTGMMDVGDIYDSNDYISAKYKEINFVCSDVKIKKSYSDGNGGRIYKVIFKGQWFVFDFCKSFRSNIQVCDKSFEGSKRGKFFDSEHYYKLDMEDADFNDIFDVYAINEFDAFYVLTPQTMEKIKELNSKLSGNLLFCFIDNRLHVGLNNMNDFFEPKINKKLNIEYDKRRIHDEIKIITGFVDILDLDSELFKRRS